MHVKFKVKSNGLHIKLGPKGPPQHAAFESPNGRRSQTFWLNQEVVVQEVADH